MTKSMQLKTLYNQLLRDSQEDQRVVEKLQEVIAKKEACVEELSAHCEDLWREIVVSSRWQRWSVLNVGEGVREVGRS